MHYRLCIAFYILTQYQLGGVIIISLKKLAGGVLALALSQTIAVSAYAEIYKGETAGIGDPVHIMFATGRHCSLRCCAYRRV